jgi:hypothetical protein
MVKFSPLKSGNVQQMVSKFIMPLELAFIYYRYKATCHKTNRIIYTTQYTASYTVLGRCKCNLIYT